MDNSGIIEAARKRMSEAVEADRENRKDSMDDLQKLVGKQWPDEVRAEREADNKPCLTINRLPQFVRQVTGDIRRMNPAINVLAGDAEASKDTAETIEGLIRHIEYRSNASSIYERAAESAAASSIGWFRIVNDWEDDDSFDQEILLKSIRNGFSVYCDPAAEMPTREDAGYIFITQNMRREEFDKTWPNKTAADAEHDGENDGMEHWHEDGSVVVAEYYWKEPVTKTIYLTNNGDVLDEEPPAPVFVVRKREVKTHKVMWAKISGTEVLEGPSEQPCKHIPVIAVTGEEWHVGERVHRSSVIRYAKDPQQMYNYWRSASTEIVALQPKAPYMVTTKQIAGLEAIWANANVKNRPYMVYNPDEKAPPPQRAMPPVASQGMMTEIMSAAEDMKATTGIYDAGLGNGSQEKSGVAIRQRQMESDVSTSIYTDNMALAIGTAGRIIIDMIPKIYDTRRIVRILGKDDQEKMVTINDQMLDQDYQPVPVNDLKVGKYDIRVAVGPNYSTRRQETSEGMIEFVRAFPSAAPIVGDLVAKAMDWPDADQFAERLKKALPPQFQDPEDMDPEQQQQMMMQQQQQMQVEQQMQQFQDQMQQIEMQKAGAEGEEAVADAEKARYEAEEKRLELLINSGQMNEAIGQLVQQEVARVLQSTFGP